VDYDGYMIVLTTENGLGPGNTIYLEPAVVAQLMQFFSDLSKESEDDD
jgi:hypothetical protein